MCSSFIPPRQVKIGDAALFAGTTPRAIRHYHEIGLLPEPHRGSDDRRRYGYGEMIRLLWIRRMADAGIPLEDIRDAFAAAAPARAGSDDDVAGILERLERNLLARETELQRQRIAVHRMHTLGSRMGLLSDIVTRRLETLPEGSLRQSDLDNLLVIERVLGPLGAAVNASRYVALATHSDLREESDRVDAAEEALDEEVAVDDPRVAQVAAARHALELVLRAVIEDSGLAEDEDALFDSWDDQHSAASDDAGNDAAQGPDGGQVTMSAYQAMGKMPYDLSPARLRCMELAEELAAR